LPRIPSLTLPSGVVCLSLRVSVPVFDRSSPRLFDYFYWLSDTREAVRTALPPNVFCFLRSVPKQCYPKTSIASKAFLPLLASSKHAPVLNQVLSLCTPFLVELPFAPLPSLANRHQDRFNCSPSDCVRPSDLLSCTL